MQNCWLFIKGNKKIFLIPILFFVIIFIILFFSTSGTTVDPFVYAIFWDKGISWGFYLGQSDQHKKHCVRFVSIW